MPATTTNRQLGRPRAELTRRIFAAALGTVREHGYQGATMDRIAARAGVAKTTIYRRWPSKGALIVDVLLDSFGPLPVEGDDPAEVLAAGVRWIAGRIGEPGVGAAFAGVFSDAIGDATLRHLLAVRLQHPYQVALEEALGEDEQRVRFLIDATVGTLLHRLGITGRPMAENDVDSLVAMVLSMLR